MNDVLVEQVYKPVFFHTLQQWGVNADTLEKQAAMLQLVDQLKEQAAQIFGPNLPVGSPSPQLVQQMLHFVRDNPTVKQAALGALR